LRRFIGEKRYMWKNLPKMPLSVTSGFSDYCCSQAGIEEAGCCMLR